MMGRKRKLPFGYRMEQGRVVVHTEEGTWVKKLYEQYAQGASMRELLASMQQTGVTYGEGMPWNLNRISRLLSDGRYAGKESYPTIITQEVFETVTQKKEKKAPAVQMTQAYKVLRQKCGKKITVHIQQEVLYLLNTLAGRPDRIKKPVVPMSKNQRLLLLQSELEEIMQELPVDEGRATRKLMEIAQVLYENIDPREYETRRLRRIFGKEECNPELDADLIAATVEEILVDGNDRVRLRLKNDQILERGK